MLNIKLDSRVKFPKGKQREFLKQVLCVLKKRQDELARMSNICTRTLADWKREKYNMSFNSLKKICEEMEIDFPKDIKILPKYWSIKEACKLGGKRHAELYGSPGTPEGRHKGGINSQNRFRTDPTHAKRIGFILRKRIKYPDESSLFSEFIGIILGDGSISSKYQLYISFNPIDKKYVTYVQRLILKLFSLSTRIQHRKKYGSLEIVVSSRNLVEFLQNQGFKKGNKITNKWNIPDWIWNKSEYKKKCIRGLIDTDGCIYSHKYKINGKIYHYKKIAFTNYSQPLLNSVEKLLSNLGFNPRKYNNRVHIYRQREVEKYFKVIGTSNPRYMQRFRY